MSLDDVVIIMSIPRRLVLAIRQRRGGRGANSPGPPTLSRPEQKPPPVVVIKRDLRDEDVDDIDRAPRSRSSRERRTGNFSIIKSVIASKFYYICIFDFIR